MNSEQPDGRFGPDPLHTTSAPRAGFNKWLGPGLIMAASGIGASDIISATVGGATYGVTLLWALALGAFFKFVLTEGLARWQLATGATLLEGWARYFPRWVLALFMAYLILWGIAVSGALVSGCGLAIENITHGAVPRTWGGCAQAVAVFAFIFAARTRGFARMMKPLIVAMFVSIVLCAALTFAEPAVALRGLFVPTIPAKGGAYVLSLIGGVGGSLTLLGYNYLLREERKVDPSHLRMVRMDLAIAYLFTAIFGLSVMVIANGVFHAPGVPITDREAVTRMAGRLAEIAGPLGFYIYSLGFMAAVLVSLIGVWQMAPAIFADCHSLLQRSSQAERDAAIAPTSWQFRAALTGMLLVSIPFAFFGRPLLLVVGFTIIGSLFIPFLAGTLLYLNNRVAWASVVPHNNRATNAALVVVFAIFLIVGALELFQIADRQ